MAMNDARGSVGDLLMLTVLVVAVLAWPLATPPIGAHGEAREGLVVQDIVQQGRWILPLRNGELPSKPPLFHWIAAGVGSVVGLSDTVVRLPSALAAWLVVLLVHGLGVAAGGRTSGWFAVGALAGMPAFFESASEARVDMLFTASVTLALVGFLRWYRTDDWWARAGCYAAVSAAVLTKGPAGVVLPTLVILVFLARERRLDRLLAFWSWGLVGAVLLVDVGWYVLASYAGGADFLARQIFHENVDRFVGRGVFGMHGGRARLAMVENLATDLLPWNLVLLWAAARWWRGEREDTIGRFLHTWWIVILVFFTAAYGKRGVYLLPLYPAMALLAGRALVAVVARLQADPVSGVHPAFVRALRRVAPERPGRALIAAVVVIDLAVVLIGQIVRVQRAGRASLVPFARAVAAAVSPTAPLVADRSLAESDLLVMAYRLAREVPRVVKGARCVPGTYRLATPRGGTPSASPLVTSTRRGVAVILVQDTETTCPLALGNEHDR
jgi:4-amino-4-deoxy-L-arabinose transferase-like glycosyltransferase